jgi:hypothetical protein
MYAPPGPMTYMPTVDMSAHCGHQCPLWTFQSCLHVRARKHTSSSSQAYSFVNFEDIATTLTSAESQRDGEYSALHKATQYLRKTPPDTRVFNCEVSKIS